MNCRNTGSGHIQTTSCDGCHTPDLIRCPSPLIEFKSTVCIAQLQNANSVLGLYLVRKNCTFSVLLVAFHSHVNVDLVSSSVQGLTLPHLAAQFPQQYLAPIFPAGQCGSSAFRSTQVMLVSPKWPTVDWRRKISWAFSMCSSTVFAWELTVFKQQVFLATRKAATSLPTTRYRTLDVITVDLSLQPSLLWGVSGPPDLSWRLGQDLSTARVGSSAQHCFNWFCVLLMRQLKLK